MIFPDVLMISPRCTRDIPRCTHGIPPMYSFCNSKFLLKISIALYIHTSMCKTVFFTRHNLILFLYISIKKRVGPERVGTFDTHNRRRLFRLKVTSDSTIFTRSHCALSKNFISSDNSTYEYVTHTSTHRELQSEN